MADPRPPGVMLHGLRVIVTGASSGLGAHTVRYLAGLGADVLAAARRLERIERLGEDLASAPGRVVPWRADVTLDGDARAMVAAAVREFGGLDALVNNAGSEVQAPIETLSEADFEGMWRANVVSVFLCIRAALPELRVTHGAVVNLGSTVVARPPRGRFGYVASKGAVEAMSKALALDLGRDGIRVNCIRPGIIPSELRGLSEDEERARMEGGINFGRQALATVGNGRDVAAAVAWLCSSEARFITGTVIDVDGGFVLGAAG
jgi:NAD(P)-dependent dehydrogenase (short-subunit alcohol dehydrogenase family)